MFLLLLFSKETMIRAIESKLKMMEHANDDGPGSVHQDSSCQDSSCTKKSIPSTNS